MASMTRIAQSGKVRVQEPDQQALKFIERNCVGSQIASEHRIERLAASLLLMQTTP
jgi:hypothetical protein